MDDYRDVDRLYVKALEKIILDAGLELPDCWGHFHEYHYTMDHMYQCACGKYRP